MDKDELRRRVAEILEEEERPDVDWSRVEALCLALNQQLPHDPAGEVCPDALYHFVDDADIRQKDEAYADRQRELMRRFVLDGEMVEHAPSVKLPLWGCLLMVSVPVALVVWWLV